MEKPAQNRAELVPENTPQTFNEDKLLNEIEKLMSNPNGFSLIRYEAKGTRELKAEQRKMSKEELKTYFEGKGGTNLLEKIFKKGIAQLQKMHEPITAEGIAKCGLTWWEYSNYRTRLAVVKNKERKTLRRSISKIKRPTTKKQKESGIPLREIPEEPDVPGRAVGFRPLDDEDLQTPSRATGEKPLEDD